MMDNIEIQQFQVKQRKTQRMNLNKYKEHKLL
jgi:hypothetical protein